MSSAGQGDSGGCNSQVLTAVLFNTSLTVDSDTGWKALSGDLTKPL